MRDQTLTLGFDVSSADVSRIENDLIFRFEDGSEVRTGLGALPEYAGPQANGLTDAGDTVDTSRLTATDNPAADGYAEYAYRPDGASQDEVALLVCIQTAAITGG